MGGVTGPAELRFKRKDGDSLFMEVTITNVLDNPDLAGLVFTLRDTHERKLLEERLTYQAFHDPLTGLANRALLADRLDPRPRRVSPGAAGPWRFFCSTSTTSRPSTTASATAPATRSWSRSGAASGLACARATPSSRLGGDEFAVLLEDIDGVEMALEVANRISRALRAPLTLDGNEVFVGGSMGIVVTRDRGETANDMLRDADVAMYSAKRHDKGRFRLFEADMRETARGRIELEADLRHALERSEMVLHFQPTVRLATGVDRGGRSAPALAPSAPGPPGPGRVHPPGRGDRPHRAHRPVGAGPGLPRGRGLARSGGEGPLCG